MAKYFFSDLSLLCIYYWHFLLQHCAANFITATGGKVNLVVIFHLKVALNHISVLIFALCVIGGLFMVQWILMFSLSLGYNRQHIPICSKMISWVRRVLSVARTHMCPGTLQGAVVSVAW